VKGRKRFIARNARDLAEILDLSAADAQAMQFQLQLTHRIIQEVSRRKLTHAQAAELAGTSRSRMTAILNGNVLDVSTDLLLRILAALGLRAKVSFSRAA
jgi:predicted XRE-type DNA-binding protein